MTLSLPSARNILLKVQCEHRCKSEVVSIEDLLRQDLINDEFESWELLLVLFHEHVNLCKAWCDMWLIEQLVIIPSHLQKVLITKQLLSHRSEAEQILFTDALKDFDTESLAIT